MKYSKLLFILVFTHSVFSAGFLSYAEEQAEPSGPIPVINQQPLYIFFLNPTPDIADTSEKGKLDCDIGYSMANINVRQFSFPPASDIDRVELDMEVHKLELGLTYGLTERAEIKLNIPYLIFWRGFLDSAIEFFEDTLNVTPPSSRGDRGRNEYKYFLRYNNRTLIDREKAENGLGDLSWIFKYKLIEEKVILPAFSLRLAVKFPTGSESKLLGSGKFDYGVGLLAQKRIKRLYLYLNSDIVFINKPDVLTPMPMDEYTVSLFLGSEYFFTKKLSLILQGGVSSTPFPKVKQVTSLEHPPGLVGLGVNYKFNKSAIFKAAVIENVSSASPDITLHTGIKLLF